MLNAIGGSENKENKTIVTATKMQLRKIYKIQYLRHFETLIPKSKASSDRLGLSLEYVPCSKFCSAYKTFFFEETSTFCDKEKTS